MDNEKVPAAMQDNVTQAEWTEDEISDLIAEAIDDSMDMDWRSHWGARSILAALDREGLTITRLASTAQPEVKALVEAVERSAKMIDKAASAAVDQDSPALAEALDNIEFRLRLALAAYHEAQP
jgi:lambda repressor-like predicted transcriptional regulator